MYVLCVDGWTRRSNSDNQMQFDGCMRTEHRMHACMQQRSAGRHGQRPDYRKPKTEKSCHASFLLLSSYSTHGCATCTSTIAQEARTHARTASKRLACHLYPGYTRLLAPSVDPRLPRTYVRTACGIESVKLTAQRNEFEGRPTAYHSWPLSSHFCLHGGIAA